MEFNGSARKALVADFSRPAGYLDDKEARTPLTKHFLALAPAKETVLGNAIP
jgi:hypothetical protein